MESLQAPAPSPVLVFPACCSQASAGSAGGDARANNNRGGVALRFPMSKF
jgi:hypothetical protein